MYENTIDSLSADTTNQHKKKHPRRGGKGGGAHRDKITQNNIIGKPCAKIDGMAGPSKRSYPLRCNSHAANSPCLGICFTDEFWRAHLVLWWFKQRANGTLTRHEVGGLKTSCMSQHIVEARLGGRLWRKERRHWEDKPVQLKHYTPRNWCHLTGDFNTPRWVPPGCVRACLYAL